MATRRTKKHMDPTPLPPIPCFSGPNARDASTMTPRERSREIAQILARGAARFIQAQRRKKKTTSDSAPRVKSV